MTSVLKGFLDGYCVLNREKKPIGYVVSCILDVEEGVITHVEMNVHDHFVLMPFSTCIVVHSHKCVRLQI